MSDVDQTNDPEVVSIFSRFRWTRDKEDVRRIMPGRKRKYLGRGSRDDFEEEPGFGGGLYTLQVIKPGNKYG